MLCRLARIGLEIKRFERRLDKGGLSEAELRRYHTLNTHYLAVLREIVLRPLRTTRGKSADGPSQEAPSLEGILTEMTAAG